MPIRDEHGSDCVGCISEGDVAVAFESAKCFAHASTTEVQERRLLDGIALTTILGERDRLDSFGESSEESSGIDFGKLSVVADADDFGVGLLGGVNDGGEVSRAEHGRFVDHDDGAFVERTRPLLSSPTRLAAVTAGIPVPCGVPSLRELMARSR